MNPVEILKLKRNNNTLTKEQISYFINGYITGEVADYQMSAFLMCVFFNGMNDEETFYLTDIMLNSGKIVDLSMLNLPKVDKHSTGGVGDKCSLILAPQVAALNVAVPMISGRGLGHTGGTLDKLESIPGFNVNYSIEDYKRILKKIGVVMSGQTSELAPADKRIYALRDVTATVDNVSLITASIMSKKLAEGAEGFVFDVTIGDGANLPDPAKSRELALKLIAVSKQFGKKAVAVLTDMSEPLGNKIGNWLEVEECIEVMNGVNIPDLIKVNNVLSGAMLYLAGKAKTIDEGEKISEDILSSGEVYKKFHEMVFEQNGSIEYIDDWKNLKRAKYSRKVFAGKDGYISKLDALKFGLASVELGGGRKKVSDNIDYLAGIIIDIKSGAKVMKGDLICVLFAEEENKIEKAIGLLKSGIEIENDKQKERKLIIEILE